MEDAELKGAVKKLYTDVYTGDGKQNPPITVRLADLESGRDDMEDRVNKIESKIDKGFWIVLGSLATAVLQLAILAFKH